MSAETSSSRPAAPKAWTTGTNPITQRSSAAQPANGLANGHGQPQEQGKAGQRESQSSDKHAHDRLMFLLANFMGLDCTLALKNGDKFVGVFSGAAVHGHEARYNLKMVRKLESSASHSSDGTSSSPTYIGNGDDHAMSFEVQDTVDLSVAGVSLGGSHSRGANGASFKTDTEISGNLDMRARVLQKWEPSADDKMDLSLGADDSLGKGGWDQFAANEKLYNVRSDYDEDLYTTKIDKSNPRYKQVAAQAERLAREIEGNSTRGAAAEADSGLDEEDKYSGVRREAPALAKGGANAYIPPSKRAITNQPTVSGAPFDPAIISSQLAKPSTGNGTQAKTDEESTDKRSKTKISSGEMSSSDLKASVAKALASGGTTNDKNKPSPAVPADDSASKAAVDGSNIMRNVTDAFKQFNQSEKLRIQAAQRQQQQQRATNARQEKSVKLNDLKKFSQNFKLNSRVPEDLVPILAKSKEKQDEIIKRADQQVREQQEQRTTTGPAVAQKPIKTDSEQPTPRTATPNESSGEAIAAPQIGSRTRSQQQAGKVTTTGAQPPRVASQANQRMQLPIRGTSAAGGPSPVSIPPVGAPGTQVDSAVLSPTSASAIRFNAKAMEFKPNPSASTFTPTASAGPDGARSKRPSVISPPPTASGRPSPPTEFFPPSHKKSKLTDIPLEAATAACFSPVARLLEQSQNDETKKSQYASNGGIPQCYRTAPVWECPEENSEKSFVDFFPKTIQPSAGPQHIAQNGALPHQHQLPLHLQNGGPHNHQQSHFYRGQPHSGGHHMDDQRMHFSSAASSVQPSPRLAQQTMVFNGQAPPQMPGYPYGMPPAGMSPAMAMRALPAGAQFTPGSPMGGHMMVQQPSNGPYGHLGQQQMQMYPSPVPTHVQPHFGGHAGSPMVGGFAGSPRANPMSHQGSQQGHVPQQMFMMPNQMMMMPHHGGPMAPMRGYSQGQYSGQHPQNAYGMHRNMSSGSYSQHVTPRQQHAVPNQQSAAAASNATATSGEEGR